MTTPANQEEDSEYDFDYDPPRLRSRPPITEGASTSRAPASPPPPPLPPPPPAVEVGKVDSEAAASLSTLRRLAALTGKLDGNIEALHRLCARGSSDACKASCDWVLCDAALCAAMRAGNIKMCDQVLPLVRSHRNAWSYPVCTCTGCKILKRQRRQQMINILCYDPFAQYWMTIGARTHHHSVVKWVAEEFHGEPTLPSDLTSAPITSPPTLPQHLGLLLSELGEEEDWTPMRRFTTEEHLAYEYDIDWIRAAHRPYHYGMQTDHVTIDHRTAPYSGDQRAEALCELLHNRVLDLDYHRFTTGPAPEGHWSWAWDCCAMHFTAPVCASPLRVGKQLISRFWDAVTLHGIPLTEARASFGLQLYRDILFQASLDLASRAGAREYPAHRKRGIQRDNVKWHQIKHTRVRSFVFEGRVHTGLFGESYMKKLKFARSFCPGIPREKWLDSEMPDLELIPTHAVTLNRGLSRCDYTSGSSNVAQ